MRLLPKYRNTFFTRLILSYTLLAGILIGLAGGYLYSQAGKMMVDEIARDSQVRLVTAKDYVENTLLRKFEENLQSTALSTVFIQSSNNLNTLLDNGWEGNATRLALLSQDLRLFVFANEGAYNMTVYFNNGDFAVDRDFFYMNPENSTDSAFLRQIGQTASNRWITRTLQDGEQVLTYVVHLPYNTPQADPKGYLFVDVELEYIKQSAAKIMSSPLERLYIFNNMGALIVQTAEENQEDVHNLQNAIGAGENVKEVTESKGGKTVLSYLDRANSDNGWTYAIARPVNSFVLSSAQFKTKIFISCGLVLLLGLFISYMISKRFNLPMKKLLSLVQPVRSLNQGNVAISPSNEYAIIGNALSFMGQKIVTLESRVKTNEMKNLVLGASLGLESLDGLPKNCHFIAAHIRLIEGYSDKLKQRYEDIKQNVRSEFVCLNSKEAAIIFFASTGKKEDETITEHLQQMKEEIGQDIRFGAAVGTSVQSAQEIPISYQMAQQALRYHFLYGAEAVVLHSEIASFDREPGLFAFDVYKNALKAGDVNGADRFIDDFVAFLGERHRQLEAVELALLQFATNLYQIVIELDLQKLVPPSNLFDELKKETLTETIESIRKLSGRIAVHVHETGNHAHAEVILKLKNYIDEHLHEDLSLNLLSEVASLAPAYISTLFGEVMKESFTEYVTRTRLEKAARLLCEEPRMPVSEIAARVGYRNPQYFHNKFKTRYGITPVQYRNTNGSAALAN
ncbi:helix-turn-helix domain-containing protein [Paenibacillus tarimensis]